MPGNCPHYGRWPQHDFTSLKKLRPQSVTSRIQPGSDVIVCAEMDEQWGYVGAKSRQRWLFYAYDRLRKTVVAHVFGERTMATLGRLMSLLSPFDVVIWMTDGWPLYESRLKGKLHVISKRYTQRIERQSGWMCSFGYWTMYGLAVWLSQRSRNGTGAADFVTGYIGQGHSQASLHYAGAK